MRNRRHVQPLLTLSTDSFCIPVLGALTGYYQPGQLSPGFLVSLLLLPLLLVHLPCVSWEHDAVCTVASSWAGDSLQHPAVCGHGLVLPLLHSLCQGIKLVELVDGVCWGCVFFFLISTQSYQGIKPVELVDGVCWGRVEFING
ncbi:hypothetical protein LAZ67_20002689 [Cordylochernes scorpioides]|uniref:Uncharacterized protein n=1 Tax=Cordylochernes scorpioides TaxID=51811 RepID=A0ABY6LLU0_9ARAC|nr:hypothetical protein LAZ67_20002689 [Cordylochernes scorpioides]